MLVGLGTIGGPPTITLGSGANFIATNNYNFLNYNPEINIFPADTPNPLTPTSYLKLATGLDDIRQLENVDLAVENNVITDAPPIAAYEFEQAWTDFNGTYNGTNSGALFVDGAVGSYGAGFNGTNSYVQISRPVSGDFSISMWIKTTDTGGTGQWYAGKGLVDGYTAANAADFGTALNGGKFSLGLGNPDTTLTSTVAVNDNTWHHVVATRQSSTGGMQIYVDGVLNTSGTGGTGTRTAASTLRLGSLRTGAAGGFFLGSLDQVHIYNYVLSAADVTYLYQRNQAQLPIANGLVAHWRLDEVSGTIARDTTINAINGTWVNSPTYGNDRPQALAFADVGSLSFNGSTQYVTMGTPTQLPAGGTSKTLCAWAKATSLSGNQFIASYGSSSTNSAMLIGLEGNTLDGGGYNNDLQVPNAVSDNNWHFYALTYDSTSHTETLYLDGAAQASSSQNILNLQPAQAFMGQLVNDQHVNPGSPGAFPWTGNIDDVRIYNRALSASEVAALSKGSP